MHENVKMFGDSVYTGFMLRSGLALTKVDDFGIFDEWRFVFRFVIAFIFVFMLRFEYFHKTMITSSKTVNMPRVELVIKMTTK